MPATANMTYLTADLPGIGGIIKQQPEDFLVEEQPLYDPCGEGEHLYLFIEKTGLTTHDVVKRIAAAFRVQKRKVSYAGLKDKHAITRQHLSVHLPGGKPEEDAEGVQRLEGSDQLRVLWHDRHKNKLQRGHLTGNRFVIRIRDVEPHAVLSVKGIVDRLAASGVPNYIGEQRFGFRNNGHVLGRQLLLGQWDAFLHELLEQGSEKDGEAIVRGREAYRQGDYIEALACWPRTLPHERQAIDALRQGKDAATAVRVIDLTQRRFLVSAWQSAVFNRVLDERVKRGIFDRLIPGDLAWKHDNRSVFAVDAETAALENETEGRVPMLEVSPSGPMWGMGMTQADGAAGEIEREALQADGVTEADLVGVDPKVNADGSRRPLRVPLMDPDYEGGVDETGPYVKLAFDLPRGAFATVVLREIMKNDAG